ncbi:MAG: hypothetical protein ABIN00_03505 [candidate division WOR-3 bacterium]
MKRVFFIIITFIYLLLFPLTRFYILKLTNSNDILRRDLKENLKKKNELLLKIDYLTSITRLEKIAFDTLNLKYPAGKDYEWLSKK